MTNEPSPLPWSIARDDIDATAVNILDAGGGQVAHVNGYSDYEDNHADASYIVSAVHSFGGWPVVPPADPAQWRLFLWGILVGVIFATILLWPFELSSQIVRTR